MGGSPETVTCSLAPPTCSLNSISVVAPTSTCSLGVSCGDMSGATARAEYSPGGSSSKTNCPWESLVTKYRKPWASSTSAIDASTIRLPEVSLTVPRMAPVDASCAHDDEATIKTRTQGQTARHRTVTCNNEGESRLDGRQFLYNTAQLAPSVR